VTLDPSLHDAIDREDKLGWAAFVAMLVLAVWLVMGADFRAVPNGPGSRASTEPVPVSAVPASIPTAKGEPR
jgi:hypothetical protein